MLRVPKNLIPLNFELPICSATSRPRARSLVGQAPHILRQPNCWAFLRCSRRAKTKIPWTYIFVEIYDAYIFGIYYNFIKWPLWNSDGVSEGPKLEFWPSGTALVFQKGQNKNIINIYLCFTSTGAYTRRKGLWLEQYICWNICCIYVRYTWKIFDIYFSKMALLEQWWCWHTMYIPS